MAQSVESESGMDSSKQFKPYGSPPPFDLDEYKDSFELWYKQWSIFLALSTIDTSLAPSQRQMYKTNMLLSCLSRATLQTVLTMGLTEEEVNNHETIICKLRERCNAGRNRHVWRHQLTLRKQLSNETADNWLCDLRDIARKCEFKTDCCSECEPARILSQVIYGVYNDDIRKKFLEQGETLTLSQAVTILRTAEAAQQEAANIVQSDSVAIQQASQFKTDRYKKIGTKNWQIKGQNNERKLSKGCWNCGSSNRHRRIECPANGKQCRICSKIGHFQTQCRSKDKTNKVNTILFNTRFVAPVVSGDMVEISVSPVSVKIPNISSNSVQILFLPDSGAEIDAIPASIFKNKFGNIKLKKSKSPETATGQKIISLGTFDSEIFWKPENKDVVNKTRTKFHVLEKLKQPILSKTTQKSLGMLHSQYPHVHVNHVDIPKLQKEVISQNMNHKTSKKVIYSDAYTVAGLQNQKKELNKLMTDFSQIFSGKCTAMKGAKHRFVLRDGVNPVTVRGSRPVSEPLLPRLKEELKLLEEQGIITPVTEPTEWVHPIVIVPKKCGGLRLCVDFRALNKAIIRPKFESTTPFQSVRTIPKGMNFFTVIDALKGYHQVKLDKKSSLMTTFSTPFGRWRYLRLPFGLSHAGDEYCRRVSEIFDNLPSSRRIVEDILIFSKTFEEHVKLVRKVFARAAEYGVSLNTKKLKFAQSSIVFGGYLIDRFGFRPDPQLMKSISNFPTPKNVTDLRAFYGLCQQVGNFSDELASVLKPLSPLLKKTVKWKWDETHDLVFREARMKLSVLSPLSFYDPKRETTLFVDASRLHGLGFVLKQEGENKKWHIVQAGSRFLSDAETRYAMIELECLAAAWAMKKCRQFLEGLQHFKLITDHRPLVPILNDYCLDRVENTRILRLMLKMQRYCFTAQWVPGKTNIEADALSRSPVDKANAIDELAEGPLSFKARAALVAVIEGSDETLVDPLLERIKTVAKIDPVMTMLRETILNGFPNDKCNLPEDLRQFWNMRHQLAIDDSDDMIVAGSRVVIPQQLRGDILRDLQNMHQGCTKTRQRARLSIYWPNIDNDIQNMVKSCSKCTKMLPSLPKEPYKMRSEASRPFEQIHVDLAQVRGRDFLIIVDQFSGWPQVFPFKNKNTTSYNVIQALRIFFTNVGVPVKLWSDNGPQFVSSEFKNFLKTWIVEHGLSSPYFHQSNGLAEAGVKSMKKLIENTWIGGSFDEDKFSKSLLMFRNAPRCGGMSPAQHVYGRPIRDCIPAHRRSFALEWQKCADMLEKRERRAKNIRIEHYNRCARKLTELAVGDHVLIQHPLSKCWETPGIIVEVGSNRDYLIKTSAGRIFRRNRRFLRKRVPVMPERHGIITNSPIQGNSQKQLIFEKKKESAEEKQEKEEKQLAEAKPKLISKKLEASSENVEKQPVPELRRSERLRRKKSLVSNKMY